MSDEYREGSVSLPYFFLQIANACFLLWYSPQTSLDGLSFQNVWIYLQSRVNVTDTIYIGRKWFLPLNINNAVKLETEAAQQTDPTCCSLYYVRSVSQAHKIKLVETPGLLVSRLHRVLPPLVNHLISWVSICNYTEHVCVWPSALHGTS